jgi:hypothetical protein
MVLAMAMMAVTASTHRAIIGRAVAGICLPGRPAERMRCGSFTVPASVVTVTTTSTVTATVAPVDRT